jgi:Tfp pilus assembly protein PilF
MRRLIVFVLLIAFSTFAFSADQKKIKEKIKKADAEFARGNVNGAEKQLRQAIEEDPSSIDAHNALAILLQATRRNSQAAPEFRKILDLDDQQKKLSATERRSTMDQWGVSTAMGGDLNKARQIYLDALKTDPDYAMFNYNLACVYAEQNDLDSALPYLKKSWEKRDTLPGGMSYPDPRKDDSFKQYLNDHRFQDAVREIVQ